MQERTRNFVEASKERHEAGLREIHAEAMRIKRLQRHLMTLRQRDFSSLTPKEKAFAIQASYPKYNTMKLGPLTKMVERGDFNRHLQGIQTNWKK